MTFLILKYDTIENSRIELRGIVLPVQVGGLLGGGPKGMSAWYICDFFLFHIEIEGKGGWIIGGGGGQRVCWPPLSNYWGACPPPPGPPLPTPMKLYLGAIGQSE